MKPATHNIHVDIQAIGTHIKQRRLASNMTQAVAASLCGVSKKTLIKIEKGGDVYLSTILQVMQAFGIRFNIDIPQTHDTKPPENNHHEWF